MKYSYYPGCTLKSKAKDLETYGLYSAQKLGIELEEIPEWQCCGGVYPMGEDDIAPKLASIRTLAKAKEKGQELVTLCSACHNVLKQVNNNVKTNKDVRISTNNFMKGDSEFELKTPYEGETTVLHFLEVLRDKIGFEELSKKVTHPLTGKKIGAYYGCLLLRPGKVMQMDSSENPTIIEDFIKAIGATPIVYAMRNECCGGYVTLDDKKLAQKKSSSILENAQDQGAKMLVTACPLCLYNLNTNGNHKDLPVTYFTQLLAAALGSKEALSALETQQMGVDASIQKGACCGK